MSVTSKTESSDSLEKDVILRIEGMTKTFPGVLALDDVSIDVRKGEILAILGENGAGKSTLMKIISGLYQPDRGKILIDENWFRQKDATTFLKEINFNEPLDSIKLGIGQVYQHFQLVGPFTVGENITLGQEFTQPDFKVGGFKITNPIIDVAKTNNEIRELSEKFGLPIDPSAMVEDLPVGLKQRTEILKQLFRKAELLILDEPTAVLTPTEVDELFKTMVNLKNSGKSLIFISHKLRESLRIADRIVVLRKGAVVGETFPGEVNERELAEMLVGRRLLNQLDRADLPKGSQILSVTDLNLKEERIEDVSDTEEKYLLRDLNFTVFKNQIVGVVGVQGNGQSELLDCLVGMLKPTSGSIRLHVNEVFELTNYNTLDILRFGVGYIPEDRTMQGLILDFNLTENSWLAFHGSDEDNLKRSKELWPQSEDNQISNYSLLQKLFLPLDKMKQLASRIVSSYEVKTPSVMTSMRNLSGGNQQKVLIGREFAKNPELIIAAEPTRGVDIGVMEKVHVELIRRRDEGTGVLLVSSDLDEILKLADYILVMYEGRIVGQGDIKEMPLEEISELMTFGERRKEESQ